jgi:hypothetical protein
MADDTLTTLRDGKAAPTSVSELLPYKEVTPCVTGGASSGRLIVDTRRSSMPLSRRDLEDVALGIDPIAQHHVAEPARLAHARARLDQPLGAA